MGELRPTKIRDLLLIGLGYVLFGWFLAFSFYSSFPAIHLLVGLPLLVLAAAEAALGLHLRRQIEHGAIGMGRRETHPITVARSAALAKASALVGVLVAGLLAGLLVYLISQLSRLHAAVVDLPGVIIGIVCGVVLAAAAVWLERGCVTPPQRPLEGA